MSSRLSSLIDSSTAPGSSDAPNHSENVAADPAPESHARMQSGQRFVDRMPANPKKWSS
ncbi:hypothetical protein BS78_08G057300 [Paspalum vaginatum]|nr:hypothetical protein BS78_08G057300 [Paspalum vaginatum]